MDIWQRGTSFSVSSSFTTYAADRFQVFNSGAEALTVARQATNDTTNLPFIQYCTRVQRNSGQTGTTLTQYGQTLESVNSIPYAGKTLTFSFYARAGANFSAASNLLGYSVQSGTGTDQNLFSVFTGATNVINSSATLTTTWQRFTYSGTVAATATQLGFQVAYTPTGTAGANDYYEITGVQLELGSVATTFSRAGGSIGGELALCQRYYYQIGGTTYTTQDFGNGSYYSTTAAYILTTFPVTMRTAPTCACVNPTSFSIFSAGASKAVTTFAASTYSPFNATNAFNVGTAATLGNGCWVEATNANATLTFSSEL